MKPTSPDQFYQQLTTSLDAGLHALLPPDIQREIGHFNVFNTTVDRGVGTSGRKTRHDKELNRYSD